MNRIIIVARNRHFPKAISLREAIKLHAEATEALTHSKANQFQQTSAGAAPTASAHNGDVS